MILGRERKYLCLVRSADLKRNHFSAVEDKRRGRDPFAGMRRWFGQRSGEMVEMPFKAVIVAAVYSVEQPQLVRHERVIALPQDRGDRLVGLERERPFLPHVIRHSSLWTNDQHQPLARGDRILNSLVKG